MEFKPFSLISRPISWNFLDGWVGSGSCKSVYRWHNFQENWERKLIRKKKKLKWIYYLSNIKIKLDFQKGKHWEDYLMKREMLHADIHVKGGQRWFISFSLDPTVDCQEISWILTIHVWWNTNNLRYKLRKVLILWQGILSSRCTTQDTDLQILLIFRFPFHYKCSLSVYITSKLRALHGLCCKRCAIDPLPARKI